MAAKVRRFTREPGFTEDFFKVRDFLHRIHEPGYQDKNWLWARWEYMFCHPALDETNLSRIGVWEDQGRIAALATYEDSPGEAFFALDPAYTYLKREMLEYALGSLSKVENGNRVLKVMLEENDLEFAALALAMGFEPTEHTDTMSMYDIPAQFPEIILPRGYSLVSLAEENDLRKINQVLWRGFNHEGDAPEDELEGRRKLQSGPDFRPDLTIAITSNGDFVSFCGMWYLEGTDYAYVEPVATDPDHRKLGLGRAAVLEGIRRCGELGAAAAYVGSAQQFYYRIGFKPLYACRWWKKSNNIRRL